MREVEALDNVVPTAAQTALYLEFRRLLDRSVRWFLTARPSPLDIGAEIERFSGIVRDLRPQVPTLLRGEEKRRLERKAAELTKAGVPEELAVRAASLLDWYSLLDIVDIATDTGREPIDVAPLYYLVSERFGIESATPAARSEETSSDTASRSPPGWGASISSTPTWNSSSAARTTRSPRRTNESDPARRGARGHQARHLRRQIGPERRSLPSSARRSASPSPTSPTRARALRRTRRSA